MNVDYVHGAHLCSRMLLGTPWGALMKAATAAVAFCDVSGRHAFVQSDVCASEWMGAKDVATIIAIEFRSGWGVFEHGKR